MSRVRTTSRLRTRTANRQVYTAARSLTVNGRAHTLLDNARTRARRLRLEFDLTHQWVVDRLTAGVCELTGIKFDLKPMKDGGQNPFSPSIDRRNPKIGYTIGNSRVVASAMNFALHSFGELVFEHIAQAYLRAQSA